MNIGLPASSRSFLRTFRMCVSTVRVVTFGEYRQIPWRSFLLAVGALVYFLTPADLIPDVLVGTGLLDDAAVVAYVLRMLHDELGEFYAWEREQATDDPDTLSPPY